MPMFIGDARSIFSASEAPRIDGIKESKEILQTWKSRGLDQGFDDTDTQLTEEDAGLESLMLDIFTANDDSPTRPKILLTEDWWSVEPETATRRKRRSALYGELLYPEDDITTPSRHTLIKNHSPRNVFLDTVKIITTKIVLPLLALGALTIFAHTSGMPVELFFYTGMLLTVSYVGLLMASLKRPVAEVDKIRI